MSKTILTVGVFDLLHFGHVELFRRAKALGKRLIVAVQDDNEVKICKPDTELTYDLAHRMYMVDAIRYVDETVVYGYVDDIVKEINFDVLVVGPDQNHARFRDAFKWCEEHGKEVIVLPRTDGISSSMLRSGKSCN